MATQPERYELHYQDETHLETNPYLSRVWHRRGVQPTVPAVGTNRRLTTFGSVEACGRGRVEVLCAEQTSACFLFYLQALEERHRQTGRQIYLERAVPHQQDQSYGPSRAQRVAARDLASPLQPRVEHEGTGMAHSQT